MIVADTSGILGLLDRDSVHHDALVEAFEATGAEWIVPWAVLPEIDHLVTSRFGREVARRFLDDVEAGRIVAEWEGSVDLARALELDARYDALSLGLVDAVVMAICERLGARAIVTLDLRDFGAVELEGDPQIWPRDWTG